MKKRFTFLTQSNENNETFVIEYDMDGNLYLNGNKVITESKLTLSWWVSCSAVLGGVGAFGVFLLEGYKLIS